MPVLDGFEATREIRRREQGTGAYTPIVALSADALATNRERARFVGMDDCITKPVARVTFHRLIAGVLARTSTRRKEAHTAPEATPPEGLKSSGPTGMRLC